MSCVYWSVGKLQTASTVKYKNSTEQGSYVHTRALLNLLQYIKRKHLTRTCTGHGGRVSISTEEVFLTAAVQRPLMVREAMRRTLGALRVPQCGFVEAGPAHWRQKNGYMSIVLNQHIHSCLLCRCTYNKKTYEMKYEWSIMLSYTVHAGNKPLHIHLMVM